MAGNISRSNELGIGRGGWLKAVTGLGIFFLFAPLLVLIVFSFNNSMQVTNWQGATLRWYGDVLRDSSLWHAIRNSLFIATASSFFATILGTMVALAVGKHRFRGRMLVQNLLHVPIILPEIILGIALLALFLLIRLPLGYVSVTCGHITFCLPFVALIVIARMSHLDPSIEEAGMDLGANRWSAFWSVVFPDLLPAVVSGALFAFTLSLDDFVVTFFTAGPEVVTLPLKIYALLRYGVTPAVNAVSTILIVFTAMAILIVSKLQDDERMRRYLKPIGLTFSIGLLALLAASIISSRGEDRLVIVNWADYMDETIVQDFERETGIKARITYFNDNEEMLAKLQQGRTGYDIVMVTGYMVEIMIKEGLLAEMDHENMPNLKHIDPRFLFIAYDPEGRRHIPYSYGTTGIGYNSERVSDEAVSSWRVFWDPAYRGRMSLLDDMLEVFWMGHRLLGWDIKDRNPEQLRQVLADLKIQKKLLKKYDSNLTRDLLVNNEVDIAQTWGGTAFKLTMEDPKFKFSLPKEGALLFVDNFCITAESKRREQAEKFLDYLMRPDVSARNMEKILYGMPNSEARRLLPEHLRDNEIMFPDMDDMSRFDVMVDLGEHMDEIQKAWLELKGR